MPLIKTENRKIEPRTVKPEAFLKLIPHPDVGKSPISFSEFIENIDKALQKHVRDALKREDVSESDKKALRKLSTGDLNKLSKINYGALKSMENNINDGNKVGVNDLKGLVKEKNKRVKEKNKRVEGSEKEAEDISSVVLGAESLAYCMLQIEACNIIILNENEQSLHGGVLLKKPSEFLNFAAKMLATAGASKARINIEKDTVYKIVTDAAKYKIEALCLKIDESLDSHFKTALDMASKIGDEEFSKEKTNEFNEFIERLKKELAVIEKFGDFSTAIGGYKSNREGYIEAIFNILPTEVQEMLKPVSQPEALPPVTVHMPTVGARTEVKSANPDVTIHLSAPPKPVSQPEALPPVTVHMPKPATEVEKPHVTIHLSASHSEEPKIKKMPVLAKSTSTFFYKVLGFFNFSTPEQISESTRTEMLTEKISNRINNEDFISNLDYRKQTAKLLAELNAIQLGENLASGSDLNEMFVEKLSSEISRRIEDDEFLRNSGYRDETESLLKECEDFPELLKEGFQETEKKFHEKVKKRKEEVDKLVNEVGNAVAKSYIEKKTLKEYASEFSSRCVNLGEQESDVIKKSYEEVKYLTDVYDRISQLSQELKDPGIPSDKKKANMEIRKSLVDFLNKNFGYIGAEFSEFAEDKKEQKAENLSGDQQGEKSLSLFDRFRSSFKRNKSEEQKPEEQKPDRKSKP